MIELNLDYQNPTKIISGACCLRNYANFDEFGKKCLVVTGKTSAIKSGALEDAKIALQKSGVEFEVFAEIENNPSIETCRNGAKVAVEFGAEFVMGIGGGSPLDAAKAIAMFAKNMDIADADIYKNEFNTPLPNVAVNTTVGTGSEVTQYSILTDNERRIKKSISSLDLFPKIAFLDPRYAMLLPRDVIASTAVDALCHAVEGFFSKRASIMSNTFAEKAMCMISKGLYALSNGSFDYDLVSDLMYGSTLAGMVIAKSGTSIVHSMGYPLTYHYGVPHGVANAYFLPEYVRMLAEVTPVSSMKLINYCGFSHINNMDTLFHKLLPLDVKITAEEIEIFTDEVMASGKANVSFRNFSRENIVKLYGVIKKTEE